MTLTHFLKKLTDLQTRHGVGIDYALFIVTRYREVLAEGRSSVNAAGEAVATAGQSVIFAGGTVVIAGAGDGGEEGRERQETRQREGAKGHDSSVSGLGRGSDCIARDPPSAKPRRPDGAPELVL